MCGPSGLGEKNVRRHRYSAMYQCLLLLVPRYSPTPTLQSVQSKLNIALTSNMIIIGHILLTEAKSWQAIRDQLDAVM